MTLFQYPHSEKVWFPYPRVKNCDYVSLNEHARQMLNLPVKYLYDVYPQSMLSLLDNTLNEVVPAEISFAEQTIFFSKSKQRWNTSNFTDHLIFSKTYHFLVIQLSNNKNKHEGMKYLISNNNIYPYRGR